MNDINRYRQRWLIRAAAGLAIFGFGACLVAEAAMKKYSGVPTLEWVTWGTLSLIVLNSGLSIFGDAILQRSRYERALEARQKQEEGAS